MLVLAAWLLAGHLGHKEKPPASATAVVTVAPPLQRDVREWDTYIGRFEPSRSVVIRPRVSGQVTGVHFRDGAVVTPGQLLFTIDPRPYEALLAEAKATLAGAHGDLTLARTNAARAMRLRGDDAVSQNDIDDRKAAVERAAAVVAKAEATVRARELDLEFTRIRAPVGGTVSDRRVDAGNQVIAGASGTLLTTINVLDPIYFSFTSSESLFMKMKRQRGAEEASLPVEIRLQDEATYTRHGTVDFTDNTLDPRSGTIRIRATFANPDLFLTPGMFGDLRLPMAGTHRALLVPDTAISSDLTRKVVFVVTGGDVVATRAVELGALVDGLRVIRAGLKPEDRVVVSGVQLVQSGQKVQPHVGNIAPQPRSISDAVTVPQAGAATIQTP